MTPQSARLLARYAIWMNTRMFEACDTLPDAERRRDLGAFFGSLHGTLDHLVWGDWMWIARFDGGEGPGVPLGATLRADWRDLRAARAAIDARIARWADALTADWLAAPFTWRSGVDGRERCMPGWVVATHLFNHATHHRGQATTLMRQLGLDPGVTDLPFMPGVEAELV